MVNSGTAIYGRNLAGPRKMATREKRALWIKEACEEDLGGRASRRLILTRAQLCVGGQQGLKSEQRP